MISPIRRCLLSLLFTLAAGIPVAAQALSWRTDYNSARREAAEKGRPLLLDFGTESCFWCKKLDATTFRDPTVVELITNQFIALKIDAEREVKLTQGLQIHSYPTLLLAAPDGKIITVIEGYLEPAKLLEHLQTTLVTCQTTPEWMTRDFQEASKAVGLGDNARAIAIFKTITGDGKDRPLQTKAREHLRILEQQADNRLAHAKSMEDKGQGLEAIESLSDLLRNYPGTPAAVEAKSRLTTLAAKPAIREMQRGRRAAELIAQAREEFRTQQFFGCLEKCEVIASTFADTPEAGEAAKIAAEIRANPEWMARACNNLNERLSSMYLSLAESWLAKGRADEATVCLQKVQQLAPGTPSAELAQNKINQLRGKSTQSAEFKKP